MARLPYLNESDLEPQDRELLARNINLMRGLVHSPPATRSISQLGYWIRHDSQIDARLRELAILQVGYLTNSQYEYSHHVKIGRDFGLSDEDIRAVALESSGQPSNLGQLEKLVLLGTRQMTNELAMSDETFTALQDQIGNQDLVELTVVIGFYNGVVRILGTLGIDVEPEYEQYLKQFPLAADSSS